MNIQIKRDLMWYRKVDVIIHDELKLIKSGFTRVSEIAEGVALDNTTVNGPNIKARSGISLLPKLNRYTRANMVTSMNQYQIR